MKTNLTATTFNIQRFSTEDGPGIRTTIFMKGCPLVCTWCHNPEGISANPQLIWYSPRCIVCQDCIAACPRKVLAFKGETLEIDRSACESCGACVDACPASALEIIGRKWSLDELLAEVLRDKIFFAESGGGVTISGGEPLMQPEFTTALLSECRAANLHTALDTTAYAAPAILERALEHAQLVLLDLKTLDPEKHRAFTGVPLQPILDNVKNVIAASGLPVWIRTPIIPGCTDTDENIAATADFIAANLPRCERYDLLAFGNLCTSKYQRLGMKFEFEKSPLIKKETMERLRETAVAHGAPNVTTSGMTKI